MPYGHLFMDLNPKTSEVVCFGSNITLLNHQYSNKLSEMTKETFLCQCDSNAITFWCECAFNKVNGNVPVNIRKLYPFESHLKILQKQNVEQQTSKNVLFSRMNPNTSL